MHDGTSSSCVCGPVGMVHRFSDFEYGFSGDIDGEPIEGLVLQIGEGVECGRCGEHEGVGFGGVPDSGGGVGG